MQGYSWPTSALAGLPFAPTRWPPPAPAPPTRRPQGDLDLHSDPWPNVSPDAKDCVKRMLEPNPARRATADEILQHPWMRENGVASNTPLDNVILRRMT